jgi:Zn-dependent peptidase ImmA (M78 family)
MSLVILLMVNFEHLQNFSQVLILKEKIADQFAMDILCPTYKVKELWEEYKNIPTLAQTFLVSNNVIEKKLKQIYKLT